MKDNVVLINRICIWAIRRGSVTAYSHSALSHMHDCVYVFYVFVNFCVCCRFTCDCDLLPTLILWIRCIRNLRLAVYLSFSPCRVFFRVAA